MRPPPYSAKRRRAGLLAAGLLGLGVAACAPAAPPPPDLPAAEAALIAARPYDSQIPLSYDAAQPAPLVLLLHGYMGSGTLEKIFFGLGPLVDAAGILLAYPDGTADSKGNLFWNATDACCNSDGASVDDVAYLTAVLHDMKRRYSVDPQRVFVIGHSNGGFMAFRLACELSDELAGIASLAGATWRDPGRCHPSSPVSVLAIHGDADTVVKYDGGAPSPPLTAPYPSAAETAATWARYQGCTGALTDSGTRLDLVSSLPGPETRVDRTQGCPHSAVELWTLGGGDHFPLLLPAFGTTVHAFFEAHPKPSR